MINRKSNLWRLFRSTKIEDLKMRYKQQRIACCLVLQNYNINKVKFLCKNKNIKNFFKYVNKTMGREKPPILLKDEYIRIVERTAL